MGHRPSVSRGHCTASTHCPDIARYSKPAQCPPERIMLDMVHQLEGTPPFGPSQQHTHCTYSAHFAQEGIFTNKVCSRCLQVYTFKYRYKQCSMFLHVGACKVLVPHCTPGPVASSHQNNPLTAAHGHIFTWPATFICFFLSIYSFFQVNIYHSWTMPMHGKFKQGKWI